MLKICIYKKRKKKKEKRKKKTPPLRVSILVSRQSLVIRMVTERTKWGAWSLTYDSKAV